MIVEKTENAPAVEEATSNDLARWHIRAIAFVIDVLPGLAVAVTMTLVWLAVPARSAWWWLSVSFLASATLLTLVNRMALPATTGWSMGRALVGIRVVRPDGCPPGPGRALCRDLTHLLDTLAVFVGWLWPLRDARRRTFADLLLGTEVRPIELTRRPKGILRLTTIVVSTAVLLCVVGAAVSIVAVLLPDRASDQTRSQLATQGPKIVTELLTYDPKSLTQDFARAQSLTTDHYRPKLVQQQNLVKKGHPVVNEYWVTDDAVLSATRGRATMLLFMQGHRGDGKEERFITATVQVSFVKGADAHWLVDDLTVVTGPKPDKGHK